MPVYVLKNKNPKVSPWVVEVEEHRIDDVVAAYADQGWSLDTKADPAEVTTAQTHKGA